MRVLHVLPSVSATWGGPSQAIFEMCRSQKRNGIDCEIATTTHPLEKDFNIYAGKMLDVNGVRVHFFKAWLGKYRLSPHLTHWLKKNIQQYDLVHIHSIFNYPALTASRLALTHKIPYIVRAQGMLYPWCLTKISRWKKSVYLSCFENKTLCRAALIHFTTEHEKSGCSFANLKKRAYVLPLGRECIARVVGDDIGKHYPNLKGKNILLFLARIHPIKGLDIFLPAIAELLKTHTEWMLVLAGGGENGHVRAVEDQIKLLGLRAHVFMTGHVHGPVKAALLKSAKVFVLPSYSENFGVSVVEAMQAGLPVVISDQIALVDDVLKHQAGLVFRLETDDICEKVENVIKDIDLRVALGSNGTRLVDDLYDWDKITPQQIKIYQKIINQKNV